MRLNRALSAVAVLVFAACSGTEGTYQLVVQKSGTGSGTVTGGPIDCGATCSAALAAGTSVTLTATP